MYKIGDRYEEYLAKQLPSFDLVKGSGRVKDRKGDLYSDHLLVEAKTTAKESFRLNAGLFQKISTEASARNRVPVMAIRVQDKDFIVLEGIQWLEALNELLDI